MLRMPRLAKTLEIIRDDPDSFYTGSLSKEIAKEIQSAGGIITEDDLNNYKVKIREPMQVPVGEYTLYSTPPPGSGAVFSLIMNILKGWYCFWGVWSRSCKTMFPSCTIFSLFKSLF